MFQPLEKGVIPNVILTALYSPRSRGASANQPLFARFNGRDRLAPSLSRVGRAQQPPHALARRLPTNEIHISLGGIIIHPVDT
jgi:hypothetical protein